jgi:hypothetical protein
MQAANMVLRAVEVEQFIAHALLDEDAARVLVDDGLFVLEDHPWSVCATEVMG